MEGISSLLNTLISVLRYNFEYLPKRILNNLNDNIFLTYLPND